MTDIFHEIEEDLRRERLHRLWDRYGIVVIALVALVIAGAAAYSGYRWWAQQQAAAASVKFEAAAQLATDGKHAEAEAAFAALAKDAPSGYRTLARFRAAGETALRDRAAGVAAFDALAADTGLTAGERDLARIRAAMLLVDGGSLAEVKARAQSVADGTSALRHAARELIALAQYKAGDLAAANASAMSIIEDPEAPYGVRSRADLMRNLTAAAVPSPAPVAPSAPASPAPATPSPAAPAAAAPAPDAGAPATK